MKDLNYLINDFNGIARKNDLQTRLGVYEEALVMGSEAQLRYGSYQCVVCGVSIAPTVVDTLIKVMCFEHGE